MEKLELNENDKVLVSTSTHEEELEVIVDEKKLQAKWDMYHTLIKLSQQKKLFHSSRYSSATIKKV